MRLCDVNNAIFLRRAQLREVYNVTLSRQVRLREMYDVTLLLRQVRLRGVYDVTPGGLAAPQSVSDQLVPGAGQPVADRTQQQGPDSAGVRAELGAAAAQRTRARVQDRLPGQSGRGRRGHG